MLFIESVKSIELWKDFGFSRNLLHWISAPELESEMEDRGQ